MINRNAGRTIVKKLPDFFGVGTLFLAICAGSWTSSVRSLLLHLSKRTSKLRRFQLQGHTR